jgi:hypothetical protein
MAMKLTGKLTPKAMGWDRNEIGSAVKKVPADGGRVLLGRIVGIVAGLRQTINNDTGEVQNGLKGNFRGFTSKVGQDGKPLDPITSGVCYLPGGIQEMIEGTLASAKEADAKATVNFAIDLYAIPATNKAGYSFDADNIVAAEQADPLDMLANQAAQIAALPAPGEDTPAATEGSETKSKETATTDKAPAKGK